MQYVINVVIMLILQRTSDDKDQVILGEKDIAKQIADNIIITNEGIRYG